MTAAAIPDAWEDPADIADALGVNNLYPLTTIWENAGLARYSVHGYRISSDVLG